MQPIIIISFLITTILAVGQNQRAKKFLILILLIFVAGLRLEGMDRDYTQYVEAFNYANFNYNIEPSFILISTIVKTLNYSHTALFLIYAIIGVTLKFVAINKLSDHVYASILLYISHFFLLHEMTQIRIGVASGLLLLAFYQKIKKENTRGFLLITGLAIFFHYSSIIILFIYPILGIRRNLYVQYLTIPLGIIIALNGYELLLQLPIPYLQRKLEIYWELKENGQLHGSNIKLFNPIMILNILLYYTILWKKKKIYDSDYTLLFLLNLSIFSFYFLSFIPVAAFRISELLGIVVIVLGTKLIDIFKTPLQGKIVFYIFCLGLISINLFRLKLIL